MVKDKVPTCECGRKLKRIYSRDSTGYHAIDFYHCSNCGEVYESQVNKKKLKKLSLEDSKKFLKTKSSLKTKETNNGCHN